MTLFNHQSDRKVFIRLLRGFEKIVFDKALTGYIKTAGEKSPAVKINQSHLTNHHY